MRKIRRRFVVIMVNSGVCPRSTLQHFTRSCRNFVHYLGFDFEVASNVPEDLCFLAGMGCIVPISSPNSAHKAKSTIFVRDLMYFV